MPFREIEMKTVANERIQRIFGFSVIRNPRRVDYRRHRRLPSPQRNTNQEKHHGANRSQLLTPHLRARSILSFSSFGATFHRCDEPVSTLRQGLDVSWVVCVIAQGGTQLVDGLIKPSLEIDKGIFRPKL